MPLLGPLWGVMTVEGGGGVAVLLKQYGHVQSCDGWFSFIFIDSQGLGVLLKEASGTYLQAG